jgi:hypothetical protein
VSHVAATNRQKVEADTNSGTESLKNNLHGLTTRPFGREVTVADTHYMMILMMKLVVFYGASG